LNTTFLDSLDLAKSNQVFDLTPGETYTFSKKPNLTISGTNVTFRRKPNVAGLDPIIQFNPSTANAPLFVTYGNGTVVDGIHITGNGNVRVWAIHSDSNTFRKVTLAAGLNSFIEQEEKPYHNQLIEDVTCLGLLNRYFIYYSFPVTGDIQNGAGAPSVICQNWTIRRTRWLGSSNEGFLRTKGMQNLTVEDSYMDALPGFKNYIFGLQHVLGATMRNNTFKGIVTCFTNDGNPNPQEWSKFKVDNVQFLGNRMYTGFYRLNSGSTNTLIDHCCIKDVAGTLDSMNSPIVCYDSPIAKLPPPTGTVRFTDASWIGASNPGMITGAKSGLNYTGQANTYSHNNGPKNPWP
jgi:hypothetical protein